MRFESAERYRFTQLTSAKGINRDFANDIFDLDNQVGKLARRCASLQELSQTETDVLSEDRDRNQNQLKKIQNSLNSAAKQILGYELDVSKPTEELETSFNKLLEESVCFSNNLLKLVSSTSVGLETSNSYPSICFAA